MKGVRKNGKFFDRKEKKKVDRRKGRRERKEEGGKEMKKEKRKRKGKNQLMDESDKTESDWGDRKTIFNGFCR